MKYIILLIIFTLSACGKKENPAAEQEDPAAETAEQAPLPVCDRTPAVRDKIKFEILLSQSLSKKCEEITAQDLSKIKEMLLISPTYKAGDFSGLTNLKKLIIWNFEMQQIPKGLFARLTNLEELDMHNSQLSRLKVGDFSGLTNLKKLDISCYTRAKENCTITKLPAGIFKGLSRLEVLDLSGQPLKSLPPGIFDHLVSLKTLNLWGNKLSEARKAQIREKCEERNISLTI